MTEDSGSFSRPKLAVRRNSKLEDAFNSDESQWSDDNDDYSQDRTDKNAATTSVPKKDPTDSPEKETILPTTCQTNESESELQPQASESVQIEPFLAASAELGAAKGDSQIQSSFHLGGSVSSTSSLFQAKSEKISARKALLGDGDGDHIDYNDWDEDSEALPLHTTQAEAEINQQSSKLTDESQDKTPSEDLKIETNSDEQMTMLFVSNAAKQASTISLPTAGTANGDEDDERYENDDKKDDESQWSEDGEANKRKPELEVEKEDDTDTSKHLPMPTPTLPSPRIAGQASTVSLPATISANKDGRVENEGVRDNVVIKENIFLMSSMTPKSKASSTPSMASSSSPRRLSSSPPRQASVQPSGSTLQYAESIETDPSYPPTPVTSAEVIPVPSKPVTAKKASKSFSRSLLAKFLPSKKSGGSSKKTTSTARKSSEPIPLSTLLLGPLDNSLVDAKRKESATSSTGENPQESSEPKMHYCSQARSCEPNLQVINQLLEEIRCVYEKSLGVNSRVHGDCQALFSQCEQLRQEVGCYENTKVENQRTIQSMSGEMQKLQFCIEESKQMKANYESIIAELRRQLERADDALNECTNEKIDLANIVRQQEVDIQNMRNQLQDLESEVRELRSNLARFESCKLRVAELQKALAECCERCDQLQHELMDAKTRIHDLMLQLETCKFEKSKLQAELDFLRQRCIDEKNQLESQICQLAETIAMLERNKLEICQRTNDILRAHHEEMDNLKKEAEDYKAQLEECRRARECLEAKLKDCEDSKRKDRAPANDCMNKQHIAEVACLKEELRFAQEMLELEKTRREECEERQKCAMEKSLEQQRGELVKCHEEQTRLSQQKIDCLQNDLEKTKFMHEQERKCKEVLEMKLRDTEDLSRKSTHELQFCQEKNDFYSQKKIDSLKSEVDKYKSSYEDEKRHREDAERKLNEVNEQKQKSLREQQLLLQVQQQEQELIAKEKMDSVKTDAEKYKTLHEVEKKSREELELRLKDLENQKLRNLQDHQQALQQHQQQQEFYTQQKLEVLKNEIEKYKLVVDEEKRAKEEIERRLRESEEQKQKNMLEHQEAFRKQQEYYREATAVEQQKREEEKVTRELWQRELRDAQRLWESEVKAKGILAEKLAKFEKMQNTVDAQTLRELEELERYKDKTRSLKSALKSEKELVVKVTNKLEEIRHAAKTYKSQLEHSLKDPKVEKLLGCIDNLKSEMEVHAEAARTDKKKLMEQIYKLDQAKWKAEKEGKKLADDIKIMEAEMSTWKNLAKMKDKIEMEFIELKRAVNDQYVDKRDVDKLKNAYEGKLVDIKAQYEKEVQIKVHDSLSQIMKQSRDRQIIEKIRDVNENTLRSELTTMNKTLHLDVETLKDIIRQRDEQIVTLRKTLDNVKEKYADESRHRECLMKKLHILSNHSLDTVPKPQTKTDQLPSALVTVPLVRL